MEVILVEKESNVFADLGPCEARTHDLGVISTTLCQLSVSEIDSTLENRVQLLQLSEKNCWDTHLSPEGHEICPGLNCRGLHTL